MMVLRTVLLLTVAASVIQGGWPPGSVHQDSYKFQSLPRNSNVEYEVDRFDFTVTLRDGVILDAVKFIPRAPIPEKGWPTVIMVHGYGNNKDTLANFCEAQAAFGYYTSTFSVRGQGNSTGLSNLISTVEAQDLVEFVGAIKADSVSGASPDNILVMGSSQGGLLPLMAASRYELNVRTIISALAPPDFASSWIENGSIKMTLLWSVIYPEEFVRYTPLVDSMASWIFADNREAWDSLARQLPIDRDFTNNIPGNSVPAIVEGSWQDKFFNGSGIIRSAMQMRVPFRMYMGAVTGHGGDTSITENQWHEQFFNDWVSYWLLGDENGVLNRPRYEFAYTTYPLIGDQWSFVHDSSRVWPPPSSSIWRLYFQQDNRLASTPNPDPGQQVVLRNEVRNDLTMREAVELEFTGPVFESKFVKNELAFDTDPLEADYAMIGIPRISLSYSSTAGPFCQFNFQMYEIEPDSSMHLVNRLNFTDRDYVADSPRVRVFEGQAHGHIFRAGNRIRLVLTNLDTAPGDTALLESNPFVLPVLINGYNSVALDSNSYVELPTVQLPMSVSGNPGSTLPDRISLGQNYPNPFNPVTVISYSIPSRTEVELAVFDILGRKVRTLVNELQSAGNHVVHFDASGLASGVYFYRLRAGQLSETRKLLLMK